MTQRVVNDFPILNESDGVELLNSVWNDEKTFIFLPDKSSVDDTWLNEQLQLVPESHKINRFCLLTSGSTGEPKLIFGVKSRTEKLSQILHIAQNLKQVKSTILLLPLTYSFAFVNQWVWSQVHNRKLILTSGLKDPSLLRQSLSAANQSMICLVGAQVTLLKAALSSCVFEGITHIHFAGGPFPQTELDSIKKIFPAAQIYNNYGCAEAMPRLTLRKSEEADIPNDVGPPLEGVKLRISTEGEIEFLSNYRADAQIAEGRFYTFPDTEWLPTGDVGEISENGHLILHGRSNSVFKRYGEKISLRQLTERVQSAWAGEAVFYKEEDSSGEPGHILVLTPQPEKAEVIKILKIFRSYFPRSHWPLRIEGLEEIPLLSNGKEDLVRISNDQAKAVYWSQRI